MSDRIQLTTAVTVLPNDITMATTGCNSNFLTDKESESAGIKHGSASKNLIAREATDLPSHVSQDVHWVVENKEWQMIDKNEICF